MKRKKYISLIVTAIVVVSSIVAFLLIKTKPIPPVNVPAPTTIRIKEYVVKNGNYSVDLVYPAKVLSQEIVKLGVQVSGKIEQGRVPLKVGQHFKKGDLLVKIYDEDAIANVKAQKSNYLTTIAKSLPDIKIDFPEQYEKWAKFFEAIDLDKPLPTLPEVHSTKEKVYLSAKNIISNYYSIKQLEIILDRYSISAPFNGVFKEVTKEVGAIVAANGEIGTIISTDNLELSLGVSPQEAKMLKVGDPVTVSLKDDKKQHGKIVRISPMVDQKTHRVIIYVLMNQSSDGIIEGQMVTATITINNINSVIRVPREIISKENKIYQIIDNKIYPVDINIVINSNEYSYLSGIQEGIRIVYESLVEPKEGTEIKVIETIENN